MLVANSLCDNSSPQTTPALSRNSFASNNQWHLIDSFTTLQRHHTRLPIASSKHSYCVKVATNHQYAIHRRGCTIAEGMDCKSISRHVRLFFSSLKNAELISLPGLTQMRMFLQTMSSPCCDKTRIWKLSVNFAWQKFPTFSRKTLQSSYKTSLTRSNTNHTFQAQHLLLLTDSSLHNRQPAPRRPHTEN